MRYRSPDGRPLDAAALEGIGLEPLAGQLGNLLTAVQRFPVQFAGQLGVERRDLLETIERFSMIVVPVLPSPPASLWKGPSAFAARHPTIGR